MLDDIQACRDSASWSQVGTAIYRQPMFRYRVPIRTDDDMVETLGAIKRRKDGRWDWWRWVSRFHEWRPGQGVAGDKDAAKAMVLYGWTTGKEPQPCLVEIDGELHQGRLLFWCDNSPSGIIDLNGLIGPYRIDQIRINRPSQPTIPRLYIIDNTWYAIRVQPDTVYIFGGQLPCAYRGRARLNDDGSISTSGDLLTKRFPIEKLRAIFDGRASYWTNP